MSKSKHTAGRIFHEYAPEHAADYAPGHAAVPIANDPKHEDGREYVGEGQSLTQWLLWDWTPQTDQRLDHIEANTFDLGDRIHYLNITVMTALFIMSVALVVMLIAVIV